jgi:hypothetical protein
MIMLDLLPPFQGFDVLGGGFRYPRFRPELFEPRCFNWGY